MSDRKRYLDERNGIAQARRPCSSLARVHRVLEAKMNIEFLECGFALFTAQKIQAIPCTAAPEPQSGTMRNYEGSFKMQAWQLPGTVLTTVGAECSCAALRADGGADHGDDYHNSSSLCHRF